MIGTHSASLRIHFVRHGETEWSLSGQHTSRTEIPLTRRGEENARKLGEHLGGVTFLRVLTSPMKRAQRTCPLTRLNPGAEIEPDLAEWDYGDYEGLRSVDIRREQPDWNIFQDGCPNGETPMQVSKRADRLISRLRKMKGNIALFSHGQFGCVLAVRWIGLPVMEGQHFLLGPASLSIFGYEIHHSEIPAIILLNAAPSGSLTSISNHLPGERRAPATRSD